VEFPAGPLGRVAGDIVPEGLGRWGAAAAQGGIEGDVVELTGHSGADADAHPLPGEVPGAESGLGQRFLQCAAQQLQAETAWDTGVRLQVWYFEDRQLQGRFHLPGQGRQPGVRGVQRGRGPGDIRPEGGNHAFAADIDVVVAVHKIST